MSSNGDGGTPAGGMNHHLSPQQEHGGKSALNVCIQGYLSCELSKMCPGSGAGFDFAAAVKRSRSRLVMLDSLQHSCDCIAC